MISDRKLEHLLICKNYDVEFKDKTTGFEDIELIKYFPIIWVIIIEDYTDLCISEYVRMEDGEIQEFFNILKQSCKKCYDEYISGGCNYVI